MPKGTLFFWRLNFKAGLLSISLKSLNACWAEPTTIRLCRWLALKKPKLDWRVENAASAPDFPRFKKRLHGP